MYNLSSIIKRLRPVRKGESIEDVLTADFLNALREGIIGLAQGDNIQRGKNIRLTKGPGWVILKADGGGPSYGSTPPVLNDFSLSPGQSDDDSGGPAVNILNGLINGHLPGSSDSGGSFGDLGHPSYNLPVSGTGVVYVKVECNTDSDSSDSGTDIGLMTSAEYGYEATIPNPTNGTYYLSLGAFTVDDSTNVVTITAGQQGIGDQGFLYCGGSGTFWGI